MWFMISMETDVTGAGWTPSCASPRPRPLRARTCETKKDSLDVTGMLPDMATRTGYRNKGGMPVRSFSQITLNIKHES